MVINQTVFRTNVPKELMEYADFPYPKNLKSYLTQPQVLNYMERYVEHFNLTALIKVSGIKFFGKYGVEGIHFR